MKVKKFIQIVLFCFAAFSSLKAQSMIGITLKHEATPFLSEPFEFCGGIYRECHIFPENNFRLRFTLENFSGGDVEISEVVAVARSTKSNNEIAVQVMDLTEEFKKSEPWPIGDDITFTSSPLIIHALNSDLLGSKRFYDIQLTIKGLRSLSSGPTKLPFSKSTDFLVFE